MKNALSAAVPFALIALACTGAPPELTEDQLAARAEFTSAEPPTPAHELDIRYESRMRLIGYDVSVSEVTPGQAFEVTWYWQVDRRLPADWSLFTHVADASDANRCNADQTSATNGCSVEADVRGRLGPSFWEEGTWVRDSETITVPTDWHSDEVVFYLGFYSGDHRLSITAGPNDGESRGRALTLPVAGARVETAAAAPHGGRG